MDLERIKVLVVLPLFLALNRLSGCPRAFLEALNFAFRLSAFFISQGVAFQHRHVIYSPTVWLSHKVRPPTHARRDGRAEKSFRPKALAPRLSQFICLINPVLSQIKFEISDVRAQVGAASIAFRNQVSA